MSAKSHHRDPLCDQLAAYEMGLLADDERLVFESHLGDCAACGEELYAHAPAVVALTTEPGVYRGALADAVGGERAGVLQRLSSWLQERASARVLAPVLVTAILALVVLLPREGAESPFADLAVLEPLPYVRVDVRAGADDSTAAIFARGMEAYLAADYSAAASELAQVLDRLRQVPGDGPDLPAGFADQTALYRGVSLLLSDRASEAIIALEGAVDSSLRPVRERARWYLCQAYLITDQPVAAEELLVELVRSPVYGVQAEALRQALHDAQ
jgi:hypothetical protein